MAEGDKPRAVSNIAPRVKKVPAETPPQTDAVNSQLAEVLQTLAKVVAENTQVMQTAVSAMSKPVATPEPVALPTQSQSMLLQAAINHSKLQQHVFGVVVLPDTGVPERRSFDTIEELLMYLAQFVNTPTHVFPYLGEPFTIKRVHGVHCLATSQGDFPLAAPDPTAEIVENWLGGEQPAPLPDDEILSS